MILFVVKKFLETENSMRNAEPRLLFRRVIEEKSFVPFRRITVTQAMKQYADVDLDQLLDDRQAMADTARAPNRDAER